MKIFFVRHGESEANLNGLFCGSTETKLTEKGENQAIEVANKLSSEVFDKIYTSPLSRAYDTALAICKYQKTEIEIVNGLIEENFGMFEGLSYSEIKEKYPELVLEWNENPVTFTFPKGESLVSFYDRTIKTYNKLINNFQGENMLIVAHSGIIRSILTCEISETLDHYWKYKVENCKVTILEYSDGYKILNGFNV